MNFTYETQGTNTFLVYSVKAEESIDSMSLGMLTNNNIPGLAPTLFTQMDSDKYIKYNVSAKISVKQFFEGQVNKKRLLGVFNGIVNAMMSAEDYMIDTNTIILDLDYIFADVSSCDTVLICLPIIGTNSSTDLSAFFKNIMFSTQFDQTENCDHVAVIINYLNSAPIFSLSEFKKVLDGLNGPSSVQQPAVQKAPVVNQPVQPPVPQKQPEKAQPKVPVQPQPTAIPTQAPVVKQPMPNIPVQNKPNIPPVPEKTDSPALKPNEKPMSFFYLMQHYNKENKAIYDAQKAAKKGASAKTDAPAIPNVPAPKKNKPISAAPAAPFAVPGAPANVGFAVPGQPAPAVTPQSNTVSQTAPVSNAPVSKVETVPVKQPAPVTSTFTPPVQPQGQSANFGETTVLGGGSIGETTVLNGAMQPTQTEMPHLIRTKNNEKIMINKPVFRIGKEKSYVDYFISDNTAVSRSHANIITREGKYLVVDTNSTNHTFVNGQMIQSNVETEIHHGDKIQLGNEDFEFKLY